MFVFWFSLEKKTVFAWSLFAFHKERTGLHFFFFFVQFFLLIFLWKCALYFSVNCFDIFNITSLEKTSDFVTKSFRCLFRFCFSFFIEFYFWWAFCVAHVKKWVFLLKTCDEKIFISFKIAGIKFPTNGLNITNSTPIKIYARLFPISILYVFLCFIQIIPNVFLFHWQQLSLFLVSFFSL